MSFALFIVVCVALGLLAGAIAVLAELVRLPPRNRRRSKVLGAPSDKCKRNGTQAVP